MKSEGDVNVSSPVGATMAAQQEAASFHNKKEDAEEKRQPRLAL